MRATVSDLSSSAAGSASDSAAEPGVCTPGPGTDARPLLPVLPRAFLDGRDLDLLSPLRWVSSAEVRATAGPLAIDPPEVDRTAIAEALALTNASYGHPRAQELAKKLADPATAVVVTGQQPGLLGGPLYAVSKAVAAASWAERLEAAGTPAVAVFWIATEDHDYREVARAAIPAGAAGDGAGGDLVRLDLGEDPAPLRPVGIRSLGPGVESVFEGLRAGGRGTRFEGWLEQLAQWYRPDARFGEAFARLMAGILGERCPLLSDALLPALKEAEASWLERFVAHHDELVAEYARRDREVEARGYPLQVSPQAAELGLTPLFFLQGLERRRISIRDGKIGLRGLAEFAQPASWLEAAIAENPAVVSPGVLARPAIQDAVLGTALQVLGPGEVSYMPQAAAPYEVLGIPAPRVALRPQALVLSRNEMAKLEATGMELGDLLAPDFELDSALAGGEGESVVAAAAAGIVGELERLRAAAESLDPSLIGPWTKTRGQIEKALTVFAGKVDRALGRRDEIARQRVAALRAACRPDGVPQERVVAAAWFPGKFGSALAEAYFRDLDLDPAGVSVVVPDRTPAAGEGSP